MLLVSHVDLHFPFAHLMAAAGPPAGAPDREAGVFAMIKPHVLQAPGHNAAWDLLETITTAGFSVADQRLLSPLQVYEIYVVHEGKPFHARLLTSMAGACLGLRLVSNRDETRAQAIARLRELLGPTDPEVARAQVPVLGDTIRSLFGRDMPFNALHVSDSPEEATRELDVAFPA